MAIPNRAATHFTVTSGVSRNRPAIGNFLPRAPWARFARSASCFGRFSTNTDPNVDPTARGVNWGFQEFRQFLKQSQVLRPGKTWLMLDEHPDSINDGYFINNPTASAWQDIPASYHCGAGEFSFADGHSEMRKWKSRTSNYNRVQYAYPTTMNFDAAGKLDLDWYLERTGYIEVATGRARFNY